MGSSRREFLHRSGAVAGGVAVGGVAVGGAILGTGAAQAAPGPWDQVPVILSRIIPPTFPDRTFNITDFGAVGNGSTDCTNAFRDAIAECNRQGGGRVLVPSGTFRTGKIHLLSNVNLHVASGGIIRFKTDAASFLPNVFTRWQGIECYNFSPFIYAIDKTNIALTGPGRIDGNAAAGPWFGFDSRRGPDWDRLQQMAVDGLAIDRRQFGSGHFLKPNMIQLYRCTNVLISDLDIRNSAMWAVHPVLCTNVTVRNIKVFTRGAMVDGCDPESCTDVHITGCQFDTGDDGIAIKSGRDIDGRRVGMPSQNIVIDNCRFLGRWGAVTIGSEMSGGARNIFAQDCTIAAGSSYRSFHAIYLKTNQRRGGVVDGVYVRRLSGGPVDRGAVHIDMRYSLTGPGFGPIVYPTIRNVHISDVTINDSPYAVRINGISQSPMTTFHMNDSTFTSIDTPTPNVNDARDVVYTNVRVNGRLLPGPTNPPPPPPPPPPPGTRFEAEDGTVSGGAVESTHVGFSGRGYVNLDNVEGSALTWTVTVESAGTYTLAFRHANGTTANRPMSLSVNGGATSTVNFPGTGAWTAYQTVTTSAALNAGSNTVRVVSTTATGGPNLDYVEVRPS